MSRMWTSSYLETRKEKQRFKYKCRSCKYTFTVTAGTIFDKTRTPISKWICAICLFKVGISANQSQCSGSWQITLHLSPGEFRVLTTDC